ncbi:hypothetical protein [Shewanella sp. SM32]|uniref:hypothetical protein n=1 Tax=Shewanella sp. SM32 TaxID=2912796 RepID=UPI0021DB6149|nr:hypothetical protein [Shewanella sp. SM32]MCU8069895.1 hypothetical protein [Shewanella sp. SM32]
MPQIDKSPHFYRDEVNFDSENIREAFKGKSFLTQKNLLKLLRMAGFKRTAEGKLEYTQLSITLALSFNKNFITASLSPTNGGYSRKHIFSYCEAEGISLHHELLCSCLNFTVSNNPSLDSLAKKLRKECGHP